MEHSEIVAFKGERTVGSGLASAYITYERSALSFQSGPDRALPPRTALLNLERARVSQWVAMKITVT